MLGASGVAIRSKGDWQEMGICYQMELEGRSGEEEGKMGSAGVHSDHGSGLRQNIWGSCLDGIGANDYCGHCCVGPQVAVMKCCFSLTISFLSAQSPFGAHLLDAHSFDAHLPLTRHLFPFHMFLFSHYCPFTVPSQHLYLLILIVIS